MTEETPASAEAPEARPWVPGEALDVGYERMLEGLTRLRWKVADAATTRKRTEREVEALEQGLDQLDSSDDVSRQGLQAQLAATRERVAALSAREEELSRESQRVQKVVDGMRTRKETLKAAYAAADVRLDTVRAGLGAELDGDLAEAEADMRRILEGFARLTLEARAWEARLA
jgi:phage shock protein A